MTPAAWFLVIYMTGNGGSIATVPMQDEQRCVEARAVIKESNSWSLITVCVRAAR